MRRSDPNASARKPRVSSAAVNCVYWSGAPSNEPGGGGCLPDAPSAAVTTAIRAKQPANNCFMSKSGFAPLSDQAFLRHRGDECPIARKYKPACEAARAMQIGRILRVQQPVIGTKRAVQPQCMIKAGSHELFLEQRPTVWRKRGIEKHHVGCVGQHALMNGRQVGQLAGRADPDIELPTGNFLAEVAFELDRPQFDGSFA